MGGADKALLALQGKPLLAHVMARLSPQVAALALSANGDPARFAGFGLPVLPDETPGLGPLGGMLAGLRFAAAGGFARVLVAPCDTPFLPANLADGLTASLARADAPAAFATRGGRAHPTIALLATSLEPALARHLRAGPRAVLSFFDAITAIPVGFDAGDADPFLNLNTPADLLAAGPDG